MFNISYGEVLVIFIVAFLVLKPYQLQDVAKIVGQWIKRLQMIRSNLLDQLFK